MYFSPKQGKSLNMHLHLEEGRISLKIALKYESVFSLWSENHVRTACRQPVGDNESARPVDQLRQPLSALGQLT